MKKIKKQNKAVSEVLGTILLLVISVSVFTVVYASFFSVDLGPDVPSVSLMGIIEDNNLIILHQGGEDIGLNTKVIMRPVQNASDSEKVEVDNYLDLDAKNDGKWNIGESFNYDLDNLSNFLEFDALEVFVVDTDSNTVIMMGTIKEAASADIEILIEITDGSSTPPIGSKIGITFTAKNNGPSETDDVSVEIVLPKILRLAEPPVGDGNYDRESGMWDIGYIDAGDSASITMEKLDVIGPSTIDTQLALIIDGSAYMDATEWDNIVKGIADAIRQGDIPYSGVGVVELTVVQYAGNPDTSVHLADVIIDNATLTVGNYDGIAGSIEIIPQVGGKASMACGIRSATDKLFDSDMNNDPNARTVVTIITGGVPNHICLSPVLSPTKYSKVINGKESAVLQRDYMLQRLWMKAGIDEIDCIVYAYPYSNAYFVPWLKSKIAFPEQITSSYTGNNRPGWVEEVTPAVGFSTVLNNYLDKIFNSGTVTATLISTSYNDPDLTNNAAEITISPT